MSTISVKLYQISTSGPAAGAVERFFSFSCQPFCLAEQTIFVILVEGTIRNISVKYFESVPLVPEMSFKTFFIYSSGCPSVWQSGPICAILVEGIMGNISVILF